MQFWYLSTFPSFTNVKNAEQAKHIPHRFLQTVGDVFCLNTEKSVILSVHFEISLRMGTDRADFGGFFTDHDMTAVAALPYLYLALGENLLHLNILQQSAVTLLVMLLNGGDPAELGGQSVETFLIGNLRKFRVHIGPLVVLSGSGGSQIFFRRADSTQLLEPELCVLFFVLRSFQEKGGNLLKAVLLCLGCEIGLLVPGLRFSRKRNLQILFGFGTCILVSHIISSCQ